MHPAKLPKYLTQEELARFFKRIRSVRDRALFAAHYGLRVDEATALTLDDLDLKNYRISVRRLKNGIGGEKPLWRHTARLLRTWIRARGPAPSPYLFTGREGPLKKRWVQRLFERYAEQAGIRGRSVHCADDRWLVGRGQRLRPHPPPALQRLGRRIIAPAP